MAGSYAKSVAKLQTIWAPQISPQRPNTVSSLVDQAGRACFAWAITAANAPPSFIARSAMDFRRSEERRVGKECVRKCRSRWSTHYQKKNTKTTREQESQTPQLSKA